jgi:predicted GIY-YIG superfamily endonuclease
MRPQTIQIYLPFGDPQGIRVAEVTTRTVQVFDVPRTEIDAFFAMPESDQVAVYYLVGEESEEGRTQCYVGQTSSPQQRFKKHLTDTDKGFWTRTLVAISRTDTKTDTHARYLEWKSIQQGNDAGRYVLKNGNAGSRPHTPAPLQAECEEIFDTIATLMATLGFPLFQPLATSAPKPTDLIVFCKGRGADAKGVYSSDGLTVFKGSICAAHPTSKSTSMHLHARRHRLIEDGTLALVDGLPVFTRDTPFKTPSGASQVVLFKASNGWSEWKTQEGMKLDEATGRGGGNVEGEE